MRHRSIKYIVLESLSWHKHEFLRPCLLIVNYCEDNVAVVHHIFDSIISCITIISGAKRATLTEEDVIVISIGEGGCHVMPRDMCT